MPFISDEQRKAAFARMKGRGGSGGGRGPTKPGDDPIMDAIGAWLFSKRGSGGKFTPLSKGKGIPGWKGGPVTLTGGAIFNVPGSNWFINFEEMDWGKLPGYGIGPYQQEFTPTFVPPKTFLGALYLVTIGVDPETGTNLAPWGTPGQLKMWYGQGMRFAEGETWKSDLLQKMGKSEAFYGKFGEDLPTYYKSFSHRRNEPRPWWAK